MPFINVANLAGAIKLHADMNIGEKESVCEEIFNQQPALLSSVLALPRIGVAVKYVDAVLNALLVVHLALRTSGICLKAISESEQEKELQRYVETAKFSDGLDNNMVAESIKQYVGYRKEPMLMAYVTSVLESTGIHNDSNENTKYALMAAFTMVGCIANAESQA